ncbi:MAG: nonstructural protein [Microviridae sp.]|nr:MAG: nonstructural protein [Microviridae sp.]
MQKSIFSVYDTKAKTFCTPFFSQNKNTALRDFKHACNDTGSHLFKSPEDYTLFELGSFDDESACFFIEPQPINIGLAIQFKEV